MTNTDLVQQPSLQANDVNQSKGDKSAFGYIILTLIVAMISGYAVALNREFYKLQGPFYDSLSYYNFMSRIMGFAQEGKWQAAIQMSLHNSTVVLPWMQLLLLAPFTHCQRWLATLVQSFWLLVYAFTLLRYFRGQRKFPTAASIAYTLPFIAAPLVFQRNGGLADFRMDLLQYFLLSCTSIWCLIAVESPRYRDWILFGLFAGCTCLVRATSPVYLVLMYGPVLAVDLFLKRAELRKYVRFYALAFAAASAVCSWYFVINFDYLKYYYCVWNIDANARLHFKASLHHVLFVLQDIGPLWLTFASVAGLDGIRRTLATQKVDLWSINWRALWISCLPCAFLVAIGAGLNEFVSMPSAFILFFLLLPLNKIHSPGSRAGKAYLYCALVITVLTAAPKYFQAGLERPWISARRSGIDRIEDVVIQDMLSRKLPVASISCTSADKVDNRVISNTLIFDKSFNLNPDTQALTRSGLKIWVDESLQYPAPVDWATLAGKSDSEKIDSFVKKCLMQDYLLVPTYESAVTLHVNTATELNSRVFAIRKRLLDSGKLTAVSEPIYATPNETLVVYKVDRPKRRLSERCDWTGVSTD